MNRQRGAALIMGLLLLLVLTLLAVAAVNMSTVNLRIVGNMQANQAAEAAASYALETALMDTNNYTPAGKDAVFTYPMSGGTVTIGARQCIYSTSTAPANKESSTDFNSGEYTHWQTTATYTDAVTGAQTTYVQVVRKIMTGNGNCL